MKKIEIRCEECGRTRMLTLAASRKTDLCGACERRRDIAKNNITVTCQHPECSSTRVIRSQNVHSVKYCIIHQYMNKAKLNNQYVKAWRARQKANE